MKLKFRVPVNFLSDMCMSMMTGKRTEGDIIFEKKKLTPTKKKKEKDRDLSPANHLIASMIPMIAETDRKKKKPKELLSMNSFDFLVLGTREHLCSVLSSQSLPRKSARIFKREICSSSLLIYNFIQTDFFRNK